MSFISISNDLVAFCGRHFVHVFNVKILSKHQGTVLAQSSTNVRQGLNSFDITRYFPAGAKTNPDKVSILTIKLSRDGTMLAVADSDKNIYIFGKNDQGWAHKLSFDTDKRVMRLQFDRGNKNLVLIDKTGDVYVRSFDGAQQLRKILGHCSLILDTILSNDSRLIFTADRDEKIRCSKFPGAHQIEYFLLGHTHSVVGISLLNNEQNMLSIGVDGSIKLWDLKEHKNTKTWNIFQVCHGIRYAKPEEHEVRKMKLTDFYGTFYFAVVIDGTKEIPVFEILLKERSIRQLGQVKMESEYCDIAWQRNILYTFNPEYHGIVKRFTVSNHGVLADADFGVNRIHDFSHDFAAFVAFNQTIVPLRKRLSSELVKTFEGEPAVEHFLAEAEKKIPRIIRAARSSRKRKAAKDASEDHSDSCSEEDTESNAGASTSKYSPRPHE